MSIVSHRFGSRRPRLCFMLTAIVPLTVNPSAHHPLPVLIDLLQLDVDNAHPRRDGGEEEEYATEDLDVVATTEGAIEDHDDTSIGSLARVSARREPHGRCYALPSSTDRQEQRHEPSVDTMSPYELMPDDGYELQRRQNTARQNACNHISLAADVTAGRFRYAHPR